MERPIRRPQQAIAIEKPALMDQGSHISIAIDPIDRGTMYAVSLFGTHGLWKTTNGGTDWDQLFTPDTDVDN